MQNFIGLIVLVQISTIYGQSLFQSLENAYFASKPPAWNLSQISPQLLYSTQENSGSATISDPSQIPDLVNQLNTGGFLSPNRQIVFVVHGFMGFMPWTTWLNNVKNDILGVEDSTIIIVNWSNGANLFYSYPTSAANTDTVGAFLSNLTIAILNSPPFNGDQSQFYAYCIGHSLGAHICGKAGRDSKLFARVTGLDPAGPAFENVPDSGHIDVDSAVCVDNYHTDGIPHVGEWDSLSPHFGTLQQWGSIDFYLNGGGNQPGCVSNTIPPCSHSAATIYFQKTINPQATIYQMDALCQGQCPTDGSQSMGYYSSCHRQSSQVLNGTYYLSTVTNGNNTFGALE